MDVIYGGCHELLEQKIDLYKVYKVHPILMPLTCIDCFHSTETYDKPVLERGEHAISEKLQEISVHVGVTVSPSTSTSLIKPRRRPRRSLSTSDIDFKRDKLDKLGAFVRMNTAL